MSRRVGWFIRAAIKGVGGIRVHRFPVPVLALFALLAMFTAGGPLPAETIRNSGFAIKSKYEEYEVRTAFLLVFAKYTEWPESALPLGSPLVIGVMGDAPLGSIPDSLAATGINGRKVVIKRFRTPGEIQPCQILYFPADQERLLPKLRGKLLGSSVLTVGETSLFIGFGGAIQLFNEEGRLRFTVNRTVLDQSRIRVEAKALVLAKQVFNQDVEVQP
jgi:hypothetical protein